MTENFLIMKKFYLTASETYLLKNNFTKNLFKSKNT